ncbi:hypothetical protein [Agromyces sp. GXS1127]|uniref:DUF7882 family protein n=1 Tax=Agromyces sp. GXS1127 TaxID=3424181 RepID=UPI003D31C9D0
MGNLHYDGKSFEMDDRLLAHLQLIIGVKLRRGENFLMSWKAPASSGDGRYALWIDNGVPLYCEYHGGRMPKLNMAWAEKLADSASKGGGLVIMAEDVPLMPEGPELEAHPDSRA